LIQSGSGCGSGSRTRFDDQNLEKFTAKKIDISLDKVAIYLSLGLQPSKKNIQHLKFLPFFNFCGPCNQINADPCGYGTGSETLVIGPQRLFYQTAGMQLIFHADSFF
jgi:hypothetical protein